MIAGLEFFYERLSKGGMIFCHDYSSGNWQGCKEAIDTFVSKKGISIVLLSDIGDTA